MSSFFQQDYIEGIDYILTTTSNVTYMFTTQQTPRQLIFNTQLNDDIGTITIINKNQQKQIQPEIVVLTIPYLQSVSSIVQSELFEAFTSTIKNINKYELVQELSNIIDKDLKRKMFENSYLSKVLIHSLDKIKKHLDKKNIRYELKAFPWHDIEDKSWEENVIHVKIECNDNKEKRKIWDKIDKIVRKNEDEGVIVLTQVDRI